MMITMKECSKSAIKQIEFCQFSIQTMKPFFNYCFFKLNWLTDWHRVHVILGSFSSLWITLSLADPHNNKICKAWHNSYIFPIGFTWIRMLLLLLLSKLSSLSSKAVWDSSSFSLNASSIYHWSWSFNGRTLKTDSTDALNTPEKWKIIEAGCWVSTVGCWRLEILFVWQWLLHWSTLVTRDRSGSTCCQHLNSGHRTERGKMISMLALANSWCWC